MTFVPLGLSMTVYVEDSFIPSLMMIAVNDYVDGS